MIGMDVVKIVAISDTHCRHKKVTVPHADVLVHAGDFSSYGNANEFIDFIRWLYALPHKHKVFIAGNHDKWLEGSSAESVNETITTLVGDDSGITYLLDSSITIEGKKFYGAPWQPEFCDWAFNVPRGKLLAEKWAKIPLDTDILITHGPAYGHGDYVPNGKRVAGCLELLKKIVEVKPEYHICGHIHEGYGRTRSDEVSITKFINASCCDANYKMTNKAHRIQL